MARASPLATVTLGNYTSTLHPREVDADDDLRKATYWPVRRQLKATASPDAVRSPRASEKYE